MKTEVVDQGVKVQYVPEQADLDTCFELGVNLAKRSRQS